MTDIVRETVEDALENDRCGICLSVDHFREDCPMDKHTGECDRHYEQHRGGCVCPTECRDLHEIQREDGSPLLPRDHWGHGCPFDADTTDTGEFLALPSGA